MSALVVKRRNPQLFTTGKDDWQTPPEIFEPLRARFGFTIDAAGSGATTRLPRWYGEGGERIDSLTDPWDVSEVYWCNPPYSKAGQQAKFVEQAAHHAVRGGTSVLLLPARTDTKVFHRYIWDRQAQRPRPWVAELHFVKGRIRFVGAEAGAPFPSIIVVFRQAVVPEP